MNIIYDLFYMFADGGVIKLLISLCEGAFFVIIALWLHKYKKELCVLQAFLKQVEEENQPGGSEEKF